jgi:hypothetical protein
MDGGRDSEWRVPRGLYRGRSVDKQANFGTGPLLSLPLSTPPASYALPVAEHALMSLFSSFVIDPVVRQARRFSGASNGGPLSHANRSTPHSTPHHVPADDGDGALDDNAPALQRPRAATDDEAREGHDGTVQGASRSLSRRATAPGAAVNIPADTAMSSNPSHTLATQLRQLQLDSPRPPTPASSHSLAGGQNAPAMSESLPADDGMRHLRARVHQIRDLAIADEEKARLMHGLMTEQYHHLRPTSPSSFISHDRPFTPTSGQSVFSENHVSSPLSAASEVDPENPYNLRPGDTEPTYRTRPANNVPDADAAGEEDEYETFDEQVALGCQHYKRNVKVQCFECRRWYTCRHCHDVVEDHNLNRVKTQNMLCMGCGTPQPAGEYCVQCGMQAACYYCEVCKLWDNNSNKKIYHCVDCGICRRGAGLGKDYVHCKVSVVLGIR